MALIYIVEDDKNISEIEAFAMKNSGHTVAEFNSAKAFYKKLPEKKPDLILLDIMLPDEDGLEILKKIRNVPETKKIPVIMVTAKTTEIDKVRGLDSGADDYITKPFSPREIATRVQVILKRTTPQKAKTNLITFGNLTIDPNAYTASIDKMPLELTPKELNVLSLFASNPGIVLSRERILNSVWGYDYYSDFRTVDTQIKRIRQKLPPEATFEIRSVYGVGYKMEAK